MRNKTFNLDNKEGIQYFDDYCSYLKSKKKTVSIEEVAEYRTPTQNKSLHLFFTWCADHLNELGIPFSWNGLKGIEMEMQWTGEIFKTFVWKPIQKTLFNTSSTTDLKRPQIDEIYTILKKYFGERGIEIVFPNKFDYFLKIHEQSYFKMQKA